VVLPLHVVDLPHQATAERTEERGISIPTDPEHVPARAPQDFIARDQDLSPPGPAVDHLLDDVVVDGIVLEGMAEEDAEVRVIAAIAVMMIEAGVDLVDGVEEADVERPGIVENECMIYSDEFGRLENLCLSKRDTNAKFTTGPGPCIISMCCLW
jgi:hypothetical protein